MSNPRKNEHQEILGRMFSMILCHIHGLYGSEVSRYMEMEVITVRKYLRELEQQGFIYRQDKRWFAERVLYHAPEGETR